MIPLALLLIAAAPDAIAAKAGDPPLTIENLGHRSIYNLYARTKRGKGWGGDRLDDATIPAGRSRTLTIAHRRGRCVQCVKLVLAGGREVVRRIDLCRGGRWTIDDQGDRLVEGEK